MSFFYSTFLFLFNVLMFSSFQKCFVCFPCAPCLSPWHPPPPFSFPIFPFEPITCVHIMWLSHVALAWCWWCRLRWPTEGNFVLLFCSVWDQQWSFRGRFLNEIFRPIVKTVSLGIFHLQAIVLVHLQPSCSYHMLWFALFPLGSKSNTAGLLPFWFFQQ